MLRAAFMVGGMAMGLAMGQIASARAAQPETPQPSRPVDMQRLAGRWYEVARVPNLAESSCPFAATHWDPMPGGKFRVTQTCSAGPGAPPGRVIHATADPLDPAGNTKWRMNYFGGLIRRDYWVLDYAPDGAWIILAMPGKHYVWVLCRDPQTPQARREEFIQRIVALGYDAGRLVFPVQLAARGE
jgi:apolipoprotein D and lipocalin family protein